MLLALLVSALLALDIAAPSVPGATDGSLHLEIKLVGRRISTEIVNSGPKVRLLIGSSCSGPEPFSLIVDGKERRYTRPVDCDKNVERVVELATGGRTRAVVSDAIEPGAYRVAVRYLGTGGGPACAGCVSGELRSKTFAVDVPRTCFTMRDAELGCQRQCDPSRPATSGARPDLPPRAALP